MAESLFIQIMWIISIIILNTDQDICRLITIKNKPVDGLWGERYFHILDPEEYELSFAQVIS